MGRDGISLTDEKGAWRWKVGRVCSVKLISFSRSPGRLDPRREPVFSHAALTAASPHIRSSLWARTIIPHARGRRARVGGTILLSGVFQPGNFAVTARPDPAKPHSASVGGVGGVG